MLLLCGKENLATLHNGIVILCTLYTILVCMYAMHVVHTGDGFGRLDCSYKHAGIGLGAG